MDLGALRGSPIGRLVPITGTDPVTASRYDHYAYLPDDLPPAVPFSPRTWTGIVRAEAALARLDQAARQVPEPSLLRRPALRREAQSTSALEGTYAPFDSVMASDPGERQRLPVELREVLNYVVAAEEGFEWVGERPLTLNVIERLQGVLVANTPSELRDAGRLREQQVVIGARGRPITESRFVPPPPGDQLRAGVEAWLRFCESPTDALPSIAKAALAHYQFETLHPFSDGNGRIGRLLIALMLRRDGVLHEPILVVSPWFEARRDAYQDGLLALGRTGDWDAWVSFFAEGVAESADATRHRIDRLLGWQERTVAAVRAAGTFGVAERVAAELIGSPIVTAPEVSRRHEVTAQGAMLALRRLAQLGVLEEQRVGGRVRFVSREVLALLRG